MMRSLFSGVSGLKSHQTKMDVIGNNIANVNTTAYKSSSMVFSALMSQTTQRASGANATTGTGGVNARQIGLGVKASSININIAGQGASQSTGNPLDIMITGENFFVVNDGTQNYFTRDGSFYIDGAGNLAMTSVGYNVMGWQVDPDTGGIKKDTVSALRIMSSANMTYPPEATSQGYMAGIIDKNDKEVTSATGRVVNMQFFDSLGYSYTAKFVFRQSDSRNDYSLELDKIVDSTGKEVAVGEEAKALLGTAGQKQKVEDALTLKDGYTWNGTTLEGPNGLQINLTDLIDNNAFKANNAEIGTAPNTTTVGEQLDLIAAAYGYEGSTDDFLNLMFSREEVPADPTATPPTEAVTSDWSIAQLLLKQGGATVPDQTVNGTAYKCPNSIEDPANTGAAVKSFDISGRFFTGTTVSFDANNGKFNGLDGSPTANTFTLQLSKLGGNFTDITVDMSETSMVDNKGTSTIGATNGADDEYNTGSGRRVGEMIGVSIQQNGMIYASYDNGMTKLLGQIATARFANASGLEKQADNLYSATLNSGDFDGIGVDITAGGDGYMSTGQLEMSNVDLSSEFTEMITTQRGFQANSRIITVSDTLLEELTNLKR
jgi:flagellar hook protein FlgE